MNNQLLEIEPKELKFSFELKKQSSCSVQLTNNTHHYVAFKVKTTAPKKYSVRPNVGVLMPKSTCEFIVTMQAPRVAPEDMVCKDKFLILSTIVPVGTSNEDITSTLFLKDISRVVEENKLKVALISPPSSPELSPINGDSKNGLAYEKDQIVSRDEILSLESMIIQKAEHRMVNEELKHEKHIKLNPEQNVGLKAMKDVEELKPETTDIEVSKDAQLNTVKDVEGLKPETADIKVSKDAELNTVKDVEELKPETADIEVSKDVELNTVKDAEEPNTEKEAELKVSTGVEELKLIEAIKEMKFKLDELESKLNEAGVTISKLTEERRLSNLETKVLEKKLADLSKRGARKVKVGFPLLYVCMVALICLFLGYSSRT